MRVLISESLTQKVLDKHEELIANADACLAIRALNGSVALTALTSGRWRTGDIPLFDATDIELARWSRFAVDMQPGADRLMPVERAMLVHGLEARLRGSVRARAMFDRLLIDGPRDSPVRVDVIASDPYVRDAFGSGRLGRNVEVRMYAGPEAPPPPLAAIREKAVGWRWLRTLDLLGRRLGQTLKRPPSRLLALFVLNQRSLDLVAPLRAELSSRGWATLVFAYNVLSAEDPGVIPFEHAGVASGAQMIKGRAWSLTTAVSERAPVSPSAVELALQASWVTGGVLTERHRQALSNLRPDAVASFGPDANSLALQAAASRLGIPSIFFPHGFLTPSPTSWFLHATATAVVGHGCVQVNRVNKLGERQDGVVITGNPSYDVIFRGQGNPIGSHEILPLRIPKERPYVALLFAEWSPDLVGHVMQKHTLEMTADALPSDVYLICKLHPGRAEREMCERILSRRLGRDAFCIVGEEQFTTPELLKVSHVALAAEHSMALSDAVIAGVPAIAIRHSEYVFGVGTWIHPAQDYQEVCQPVASASELAEALVRLSRDGYARRELTRRRADYVERFLFVADGRSTVRAADLVEHLAAGGSPDSFEPSRGRSLLE